MKLPFPTTSSTSSHITVPRHQLSSSFPAKLCSSSSSRRSRWAHMQLRRRSSSSAICSIKVVVIMGATGTGKSRLSLDLATRFFPHSEIINSDKMQVYRGLEITTNKLSLRHRLAVPHHLLASLSSPPELSPAAFRRLASSIISDLTSLGKLPLLVGGSNSFIHSLLSSHYDPDHDFFSGPVSVSGRAVEPRYDCCFIWVDVGFSVLEQYLMKRVDDMLDEGMFEELKEFYKSDPVAYSGRVGIMKAIGVPEFEEYFSRFANGEASEDDVEERECYERAVREIKDNTRQLAERQIGKILRLRDVAGWDLNRLDATDAVRGVMTSDPRADDVWEKCVLEPSMKIVSRFLA